MKIIIKLFCLVLTAYLAMSCSGDNSIAVDDQPVSTQGFGLELAERAKEEKDKTRAISDFVVNRTGDPTLDATRLTGANNWRLYVQMFDHNNQPYVPGTDTCIYQVDRWMPQTAPMLYFPNYLSTRVEAELFPPSWVTNAQQIQRDQSPDGVLLEQDILVQNGLIYHIAPAHISTIQLRHKHSMLDFIIADIDYDEIASVSVFVTEEGNQVEYIPYKVQRGAGNDEPHEFLVIVPTGVSNPIITIRTQRGAQYSVLVNNISPTAINTCYCIKLIGIELILSSVTVIDWVYGEALPGQYTTITSYPTFRGNPNTSVTLYFSNALSQVISFNNRGESTVKPAGRTIIQINENVLTTPVVLNTMYVDLLPYL